MLAGSFFTYTKNREDEGVLEFTIQLNSGHALYKGHFPGMPIVPGVCQVQIIKEVLESHLGKVLQLTDARDIKFLAMVNPLEQDQLTGVISYVLKDETFFNVKSTLSFGTTNCFKFRGRFCGER